MSKIRVFLVLTLWLLSCTQLLAQIEFPEDHFLRGNYKQLILKNKPLLKNAFDKISEELYQARKRVVPNPEEYANTYRHYIVDSDELNAFIVQDNKMIEPGGLFSKPVYEIRDNVVITKGLLQSFLRSSNSSEEFAGLMAGVLAHEFAHPMEKKNGVIPNDNWFVRAYKSQSVEVWTDSQAIDILAEAKYPEDSLYKALASLFETSKQITEKGAQSQVDEKIVNTKKTIDAFVSTHPEQNIRQSYQRFLLTLRRYNQGLVDSEIESVLRNSQFEAIKKELDIKMAKSSIPTTRIKNLEEAWSRYESLGDVRSYSSSIRNLAERELNYTFYWITDYYGKNAAQITPKEANRFRILVHDVMKRNAFDPLAHKANITTKDSDSMKASKVEKAILFKEEFGKGYFDLMKENTFLKDEHFMLKFFTTQSYRNEGYGSKTKVKEYVDSIDYSIPAKTTVEEELSHIASLDDAYEFLDEVLKGEMDKYMLRETSTKYIRDVLVKYIQKAKGGAALKNLTYYLSTVSLENQALILVELRPFLQRNLEQRVKFFEKSFKISENLKSPSKVNHHQLSTAQYFIKKDKSIRTQKSVYQSFREKVKEIKVGKKKWLNFLWKHRAELALIGMLTGDSDYRLDWGVLFEYKSLGYEEGMNNLREAIKSYTQTQDFLKLADLFDKGSDYQNWTNIEKYNRLPWARADLWEYLSGYHNPAITHPKTKEKLKSLFGRGLFFTNPELRNGYIYDDLLSILENYSNEVLVMDFNAEEVGTIQQYYGRDMLEKNSYAPSVVEMEEIARRRRRREYYDDFEEYDRDEVTKELNRVLNVNRYEIWQLDLEYLWAKAITRSSYSLEIKKELLERLLLVERKNWLEKENSLKIRDILISHGIVKTNSELLSRLGRQNFKKSKWIGNSVFSVSVPNNIVLKKFYNDFLREINDVAKGPLSDKLKYKEYMVFHERVLEPVQSDKKKHPNVRKIADKIFSNILELKIKEDLKRDAFIKVYKNNPTKLSDQYFVKKMFEKSFSKNWIEKGNDGHWKNYKPWPGFLSHKFIWDRGLLLNKVEEYVTKLLLRGDKDELRGSATSIAAQMDDDVPHSSMQKDRLLEKMATDLEINNLETLKTIESYKTFYKMKEIKPKGINIFSAISQYIDFMSEDQVVTLIKFIKNEQEHLSNEVKEIFKAALKKDIGKSSLIWKQVRKGASFESIFEQLVFQIEATLSGAEAKERMPLYEILFNKGVMPLIKRADFIDYVLEEIVEMKPDSLNYPYLKSYVESALEHEKSVILAYIISQNSMVGDDPSAIKDIFERHGVVGKKTGQWISLLNIMDEKYSDVLAELKTKAEPLSRYQMVKKLTDKLTPEEFSKVKSIKAILGSASTKTVVKIELTNGKEIVGSIQADEALLQTKTQIEFFQRFIDRLAANSVYKLSAFNQELYKLFTANILNELNFEIEKRDIETFKTVVEKLNRNGQAVEWEIQSVELANELTSSKELLFTEIAPGKPMTDISKSSELTSAEGAVGDFLGRLFMEEGYVEADRHRGNQLVSMDQNKKVITFLDIAQFKKFNKGTIFTPDTRTRVVGLLNSLQNKDSKNLYYFLKSLKTGKKIEKNKVASLINDLEALLNSGASEAEAMIQSFELYYEYGGKINADFLTYFFKSFLTINAENYLDAESLKQQLVEAAKNLVDKKKPYFFFYKSRFENCSKQYKP